MPAPRARADQPRPGGRTPEEARLSSRRTGPPADPAVAAFVRRALLVGLLVALTVFAFARLNKTLLVSFDMMPDHTGPFHIYHAGPDGVFSDRNSLTRYAQGNAWHTQAVKIETVRALGMLRLDPMTRAGKVTLGSVNISSDWGRLHLQGPALQAAMLRPNDLQTEAVEPGLLKMTATGNSPYFHLQLPKSLLEPSPFVQVPRAVLAGLVAGCLWWLLEHATHRLRLARPPLHARLTNALHRGWTVPMVACLGLTVMAQSRLDNYPILGDGVQNLLMAVNVFKHNTLSLDNNQDTPRPTNFREPLPSLLAGIHLKLFAPEARGQAFSAFQAGALTHTVKLVNLGWVFAGLLGVWMTAQRAGRNNFVGLIASLLAYHFFFKAPESVNTMYTELATASLMVWCSYALLRATQQQALGWFFASGILLGLLTLTKAAFFYIGFASIGLLLLVLWFDKNKKRSGLSRVVQSAAVMGLGFVLVLAPWVVRNEIQFDSARVNSRGELILWGRAILNSMSNEEVLGLIYDQAPTLYKRAVAGTALAARDGDFERGGRWQRLNRYHSSFWESDRMAAYAGEPEKAISFHFKSGAEANKRVRELTLQGHPNPDLAVGQQMKREAWQMIRAQPLRHLLMTAPFFWHGFWSMKSIELPLVSVATQDAVVEVINLLAGICLIGVFLRGLWTVNVPRVALTVLPVGMMAFYAFLTHNIHRYSTPTHPMMLLVLVLVARGLGQRLLAGRQPGSVDVR
jgi:hypothetical protein